MERSLVAGALAGAFVLTVTLAAQDPPQPQPPRTPTTQDQPRTQMQGSMVTVEGCVMREADVPGRKPNVAERAGMAEDYILTNAKMIKGTAPGTTAQAKPGETPTGTAGMQGAMYEIEGLDDEKLKPHVGHRVQVDGMFENVDRSRATPESGTPADDLVEIRVTTIRQVSGTCPPK